MKGYLQERNLESTFAPVGGVLSYFLSCEGLTIAVVRLSFFIPTFNITLYVVICFQVCIFDILNTVILKTRNG